jgi:phage terminase large subunit
VAKASRILQKNADALATGKYRIIANKGGTRSTKTWSLLQLMLIIATSQKVLISIVSESMPHLRKGAMRDMERILDNAKLVEDKHYQRNRTENTLTFPNGGMVEFFSVDSYTKVHGAQRDYLYINECNNIEWEIYRQLAIRTSKVVFLDWNPRSAFWWDERLEGRGDSILIKSTYLDNPFLSASQIAEIESNKGDENWWRVYGLGENGSVEGLVYSRYRIVQSIPSTGKMRFYCIDFGFTNDPTAILRVTLQGGELWIEELAYQVGMLNKDIAEVLVNSGATRLDNIVADSAEPKSIAEINAIGGLNIKATTKGQGSIVAGIGAVQAYQLNVMSDALGLIEELRNYSWKKDINGNYLNIPVDKYNHALDALRYGVTTYLMAKRQLSVPRARFGHIH